MAPWKGEEEEEEEVVGLQGRRRPWHQNTTSTTISTATGNGSVDFKEEEEEEELNGVAGTDYSSTSEDDVTHYGTTSEEDVPELEFERPALEKLPKHKIHCPNCNYCISKVVLCKPNTVQVQPPDEPREPFGCFSFFSIAGNHFNVFRIFQRNNRGANKQNSYRTSVVAAANPSSNFTNDKGNEVFDHEGSGCDRFPISKDKQNHSSDVTDEKEIMVIDQPGSDFDLLPTSMNNQNSQLTSFKAANDYFDVTDEKGIAVFDQQDEKGSMVTDHQGIGYDLFRFFKNKQNPLTPAIATNHSPDIIDEKGVRVTDQQGGCFDLFRMPTSIMNVNHSSDVKDEEGIVVNDQQGSCFDLFRMLKSIMGINHFYDVKKGIMVNDQQGSCFDLFRMLKSMLKVNHSSDVKDEKGIMMNDQQGTNPEQCVEKYEVPALHTSRNNCRPSTQAYVSLGEIMYQGRRKGVAPSNNRFVPHVNVTILTAEELAPHLVGTKTCANDNIMQEGTLSTKSESKIPEGTNEPGTSQSTNNVIDASKHTTLCETKSSKTLEIVKSIVCGGLRESISSLSVVSYAVAAEGTTGKPFKHFSFWLIMQK